MPQAGKRKITDAELVYNQGLYSGFFAPGGAKAGFAARLDLSAYVPALMGTGVLCYLVLGLGFLPPAHVPATGLALALSVLALAGSLALFRSRPGLGPAQPTAWPP